MDILDRLNKFFPGCGQLRYLNIGCGDRFHPDWVNVDFIARGSSVIPHNLLKGLPFESNSFDVVYHSHLLEHFSKEDGVVLIRECYRVLKTGGVLRVAVPDLEQIAAQYLRNLNAVTRVCNDRTVADYEWSVIEMIDQLSREESGGEMLKTWTQTNIVNEETIRERVGDEFERFRSQWLLKRPDIGKARDFGIRSWVRSNIKRWILKVCGVDMRDVEVGRFRNHGECHKWMYDRFSLSKLLVQEGFKEPRILNAFESGISGWAYYSFLDLEGDKARKPDSLFIEGVK